MGWSKNCFTWGGQTLVHLVCEWPLIIILMLQFGKLVWFAILTNSIITQAQKETFITLSDILMKSQFKTFLVNPIKKQKSKSNLGNYSIKTQRLWPELDLNLTQPNTSITSWLRQAWTCYLSSINPKKWKWFDCRQKFLSHCQN